MAEVTPETPEAPAEPEGFTGRYRIGPEVAPVRVVVISDYQCPDCNTVEDQIREVLDEYKDTGKLSFSAKHFPMSNSCNRYLGSNNMHPNACWAARAAETAGRLRGNEGFMEMHRWLFARKGSFTDAELRQGLVELGYEPNEFITICLGAVPGLKFIWSCLCAF